jgi:hypothetical protein
MVEVLTNMSNFFSAQNRNDLFSHRFCCTKNH